MHWPAQAVGTADPHVALGGWVSVSGLANVGPSQGPSQSCGGGTALGSSPQGPWALVFPGLMTLFECVLSYLYELRRY